jgi:hypothetical protein
LRRCDAAIYKAIKYRTPAPPVARQGIHHHGYIGFHKNETAVTTCDICSSTDDNRDNDSHRDSHRSFIAHDFSPGPGKICLLKWLLAATNEKSAAVSLVLASFRASYSSFQATDPVYLSLFSSEIASISTGVTYEILNDAASYLLTWFPAPGAGDGLTSKTTGLPRDIQSFLSSYASLEYAVASSILNPLDDAQ